MEKLAVRGGDPVRKKPFPSAMLGASLTGEEELKELAQVVREQSPFRFYGIGNPAKTAEAEEVLRRQIGTRFALAVSSGTAALQCALAAAELGPGDEVILPAFAWYTDFCVPVSMGITPVLCDIGEDLNMDPEDMESKITPRTRAVIPVHYQGAPARMDRILEIADRHGLTVIEDVAQALGGSFQGKTLGTFGKLAITSFQTHKMLTCGEGGMVFTDDEAAFVRAVRYHDLGGVRPFFMEQLENKDLGGEDQRFAGLQLRMSELQGAYLLAQARRLPLILETCRRHHRRMREALSDCRSFRIRYTEGDCGFAFFMLFETAKQAARFGEALAAEGIPCGPSSYCCNLAERVPARNKAMVHPALPPFGRGWPGESMSYASEKDCPRTNGLVARSLAVSAGPLYTDEDIEDIIRAVKKVAAWML